MEIGFDELKKECKAVAEEFIEELELLPVFLNFYPDVQEKWLHELKLSAEQITKISQVVDVYAKKKVELENKKLPTTREDVVKIEDTVLREMYQGIVLKSDNIDPDIMQKVINAKYPDAAVLGPKELEKLELLTLFKEHQKRFPTDFLVFDPISGKIIGFEVIKRGE
jgi:hypothetical protein